MSSRLFACFTLIENVTKGEENKFEISSISKSDEDGRTKTRMFHVQQLPILPFLESWVLVESSSLGPNVEQKIVQFSAYEGSATQPPRDSILGSHVPRHVNILAMVQALEQMNLMLSKHEENPLILDSLRSLSQFLQQVEHSKNGEQWREECAKTMPFPWVSLRFQKAANLYRLDIDRICESMEGKSNFRQADVYLNLEKKLAESLGRAISYHLRRFFNSICGNVTEFPGLEEPVFKRQSKIHTLLQMNLPDWYEVPKDSAVMDGSVSTVFSQAAETIARQFGVDVFLAQTFILPLIPNEFCQHQACHLGLGKDGFSEEEIENITSEVLSAQGFLAGAKACKFISELLNWPGVNDEILRLGGWSLIEDYATTLRTYKLYKLSPYESHFILFGNIQEFTSRVNRCWLEMQTAVEECTSSLNALWKRLECDNTKKRKIFPIINYFRDLLLDGLKAHMFPNLIPPGSVKKNRKKVKAFLADEAEK
jgi:hypothetical protein